MRDHSLEDLRAAKGAPVYDAAGDEIGKVEEIFYDDATNRPEWIGIGTGLLHTKRVLVPLAGATLAGDGFRVPYAREQVKRSPDVDADEISPALERELQAYYGLDVSGAAATDTRVEEELELGTREVEAGRVRLRKWVETEPVALPVELRLERARVVRRPIGETVTEARIGEADFELPLHAERPTLRKEVVAKERVAVARERVTEARTATAGLRRERVAVDGEDGLR